MNAFFFSVMQVLKNNSYFRTVLLCEKGGQGTELLHALPAASEPGVIRSVGTALRV